MMVPSGALNFATSADDRLRPPADTGNRLPSTSSVPYISSASRRLTITAPVRSR